MASAKTALSSLVSPNDVGCAHLPLPSAVEWRHVLACFSSRETPYGDIGNISAPTIGSFKGEGLISTNQKTCFKLSMTYMAEVFISGIPDMQMSLVCK